MTAETEIQWDGDTLSRWVILDGRRVLLSASRDMIHSLSFYNDAVSWEIERHKVDIFERLRPLLLAALRERQR